jgi:hypothetical protein
MVFCFKKKRLTNYPTYGWRGIRTPGILNTSVFKTDSFNRSDIHPYLNQIMSSKEPIINLILICYGNENLGKEAIKNEEKF